ILSPARLPVPPLSRTGSTVQNITSGKHVHHHILRCCCWRATIRRPTNRRMLSDHMSTSALYHGLFEWHAGQNGQPHVSLTAARPPMIPCPTTGRPLRVATLDANAAAICPGCQAHGQGGFVSFEADLRMAYACPQCRQLVWIAGL